MDQNQNSKHPQYENDNCNTDTKSCSTPMGPMTLNDEMSGLNLLDKETCNAVLTSTDMGAMYYNMHHKYRGKALIFNHVHFQIKGLGPREGAEVDSFNLEASLKKLGFDVIVYVDLTLDELNKTIDHWLDIDYTDHDCFLMAVLSHGDSRNISALDTHYPKENLWKKFTDDKCVTLVGKPKLFFIQACRGNLLDDGVKIRTLVDGSSLLNTQHNADFLIAYSTVPGFYSWRNQRNGSWFIRALYEVFDKYGFELDLLNLLTIVNRKVANEYESNSDDKTFHKKKQIPCITFTLTKVLTFEKKLF